MALEDLTAWAERAGTELARFAEGFEETYGYEPDDQDITTARAAFEDRVSGLPDQVATLFGAIEEVSWPDVWNGYFIGPADEMVRRFHEGEPGSVAVDAEIHKAMQVGSDGGGAYFVVDIDADGAVLRVSDAAVTDGLLRGTVAQIAPNVDAFLDALLSNLQAVARGDRPTF